MKKFLITLGIPALVSILAWILAGDVPAESLTYAKEYPTGQVVIDLPAGTRHIGDGSVGGIAIKTEAFKEHVKNGNLEGVVVMNGGTQLNLAAFATKQFRPDHVGRRYLSFIPIEVDLPERLTFRITDINTETGVVKYELVKEGRAWVIGLGVLTFFIIAIVRERRQQRTSRRLAHAS